MEFYDDFINSFENTNDFFQDGKIFNLKNIFVIKTFLEVRKLFSKLVKVENLKKN